MAQHASERQLSVASKGISTSTLTLTPTVPLSVPVSHSLVRRVPLFSVGHWQTFAPLEPVTESILVTTTRALETLLTATPSQGYVTFDTHFTVAASIVGPLLFG